MHMAVGVRSKVASAVAVLQGSDTVAVAVAVNVPDAVAVGLAVPVGAAAVRVCEIAVCVPAMDVSTAPCVAVWRAAAVWVPETAVATTSGVPVTVAGVALGVTGEGVNVLDGVTVGVKDGGTNCVGVACKVLVVPPGVGEGPGVLLGVGVSLAGVMDAVTSWVGVLTRVGVTRCCGGGANVSAPNPRQ
jgi:hypothetical protein